MSKDEIMDFFYAHGLHISDGFSPCSGEDHAAMRVAAVELENIFIQERKDSLENQADAQEPSQ